MIDPHARLLRELLVLADPAATIETHARRWASATFEGMRHVYRVRLDGTGAAARAERLRATLPDHEFAIPGHLVADIAASRAGDVVTIEALTLEER